MLKCLLALLQLKQMKKISLFFILFLFTSCSAKNLEFNPYATAAKHLFNHLTEEKNEKD